MHASPRSAPVSYLNTSMEISQIQHIFHRSWAKHAFYFLKERPWDGLSVWLFCPSYTSIQCTCLNITGYPTLFSVLLPLLVEFSFSAFRRYAFCIVYFKQQQQQFFFKKKCPFIICLASRKNAKNHPTSIIFVAPPKISTYIIITYL